MSRCPFIAQSYITCLLIFFSSIAFTAQKNPLDVLILFLLFTANVTSPVVFLSLMKEKRFFNGSEPWVLQYLKADVEDEQNNSEIKHNFHWLVQINAFFYSSESLTVCVTRPWNSFSLEHSLESCSHWFSPHEQRIWEPKRRQNQEISGLGLKHQREKPGDFLPEHWHFSARGTAESLVFAWVCEWRSIVGHCLFTWVSCVCVWVCFSLCGKRTSQSANSL